jgi:hypothetical protein
MDAHKTCNPNDTVSKPKSYNNSVCEGTNEIMRLRKFQMNGESIEFVSIRVCIFSCLSLVSLMV